MPKTHLIAILFSFVTPKLDKYFQDKFSGKKAIKRDEKNSKIHKVSAST